jgi:hypothetical protein
MFYTETQGTMLDTIIYPDFVLEKVQVKSGDAKYNQLIEFGSSIAIKDAGLERCLSTSPAYIRCCQYLGCCLANASSEALAHFRDLFADLFEFEDILIQVTKTRTKTITKRVIRTGALNVIAIGLLRVYLKKSRLYSSFSNNRTNWVRFTPEVIAFCTILLDVFYVGSVHFGVDSSRHLGLFASREIKPRTCIASGIGLRSTFQQTAYGSEGQGIFGTAYFINSRYADENINVEVSSDPTGTLDVFVAEIVEGSDCYEWVKESRENMTGIYVSTTGRLEPGDQLLWEYMNFEESPNPKKHK